MNTPVVKTEILEYLKNSDDDNLLSDIARLIKVNEDYDNIVFTAEQRETVLNAVKQYEEGNYMTNEVAENEIQKWLKD